MVELVVYYGADVTFRMIVLLQCGLLVGLLWQCNVVHHCSSLAVVRLLYFWWGCSMQPTEACAPQPLRPAEAVNRKPCPRDHVMGPHPYNHQLNHI